MVIANKISYSLVLDTLKESADFNEAIATIEKALNVAKKGAISKKKSADSELDNLEIEEAAKITKKDINTAQNKIDSIKELQRFFKRQIDNQRPLNNMNANIYTFVKKVIENRLTIADIETVLLQQ